MPRWAPVKSRPALAIAGALAVCGIGVSAYLLYTRWSGTQLYCTGLHSCTTVQSSPYADVAGVPVALLGLLFYCAALGGVVLSARSIEPGAWLVGTFALALSAMLYSAYLTYLELRVINAVCVWCVVSAGLVAAIVAALLLALLAEAGTPAETVGIGSRRAGSR